MLTRSKRRRLMEMKGLTLLSFAKDCLQLLGTLLTLEDLSVACAISKIASRKFGDVREKLQHVLVCGDNSSAVLRYCRNLRYITISQVYDRLTLGNVIYVLRINKKLKRVSFFECYLSELFLSSLLRLHHLEDLRLERSSNTKSITRSIHLFRNLSTFRIDCFIPEFAGVSTIKSLAVSCGALYGPLISDLPIYCPELKYLSMSFVIQSTMCAFTHLQHLQHLTKIDMHFKSFVDISSLQICKKLRHLSLLCSLNVVDTDEIIQGLPVIGRFCKQLRSIAFRFQHCNIGEGVAKFLKECTDHDLRKLGLHFVWVMDIISLTNITMPNLEQLGIDEWDGDWNAIFKFAPNLQLLSTFGEGVPAVVANWKLRSREAQPFANQTRYRYSFERI